MVRIATPAKGVMIEPFPTGGVFTTFSGCFFELQRLQHFGMVTG
jgi:hypothetical protein